MPRNDDPAGRGRPRAKPPVDDDLPTPPLEPRDEAYDDIKTPPLELTAAGEVEQQQAAPAEQGSLPKVMAPELDDNPTIPAMDHLGRRVRPGRPAAPTTGQEVAIDPTQEVQPAGGPRGKAWLALPVLLVLLAGGLWLWSRLGTPTAAEDAVDAAVPLAVPLALGRDSGAAVDSATTILDSASPDLGAAPDLGNLTGRRRVPRRLWLQTRPAGARVLIGSRRIGVTPLRGVAVSTGRVVLTLVHPGYVTRQLPLGPGRRPIRLGVVGLHAEPTRRPARLPGVLQIATRSAGGLITADIYLDGKKIGQSPLYQRGVSPGLHRVEARRRGFRAASRQVKVSPGEESSVVLVLRKQR